MPALHIQLLGDFRLVFADAPVSNVTSPRLQSLLAYLLLHRDALQGRQHLAFLLWPDTSEAQARTNLRQLLHSLKQTLPAADQFIHADAQTLQWRSDAPFRLDVAEFEAALAQAAAAEQTGDSHAERVALEHASATYQGELLPSCYDDWIVPERERLRQAFLAALERLMLLLEREHDPRAAIGYAQRLLRHDPLREETYRALMRLHAASGDRAGALRVYHTCATVLERELAVEPSAATREAYEQLLKVEAQARPVLPPQPSNTNLPVPLTSFVGREAEMTKVVHLLQTTRLLTLTGPGGCGKTRLALEAATNLLDSYPDGVWWVELAAISDASLVPQAVATALGVREQSGRPLLETLVEYLRAKGLLLLLDNCEHLVGVCAHLTEQWLSACPHLRILATSREALWIGGETTWLVPSLSLPEAQPPATVEELMRSEAIRLFVERATTVLPTFRLTAANAPLVAQICRRLDGIPLAIELAAARVKVLTAEQIAARLDDVFQLLTAGRRTALLRHQTLRAALDWSYELLSDRERVLFRRLAVFAGGWTIEAAEAVCVGEGLEADDVLEVLSHLVDKSLIAVTQDRTTRYRLLETARQYGMERLREVGEFETMRRRHAEYYLALAEEAEPHFRGAEQQVWLDRLEAEHDNLRAMLGYALESGQGEIGLRLAGAVSPFWSLRGYLSEGQDWLNKALQAGGASTVIRLKALHGAGDLAWGQGNYVVVRQRWEECVALRAEVGDHPSIAHALGWLAHMWREDGDYTVARSLCEESLAMYQRLGDKRGTTWPLVILGEIARDLGDYRAAHLYMEEALAIERKFENSVNIAWVLNKLGLMALTQADYPLARLCFEEALVIGRRLGITRRICSSLNNLGQVACDQGDYPTAHFLLEECLMTRRKLGDRLGIANSLTALAKVAFAQGDYIEACGLESESLAIKRELGDKVGMTISLNNLARVARTKGDYTVARCLVEEGLSIAQKLEHKVGIALSLYNLAGISAAQRDYATACALFKQSLSIQQGLEAKAGIAECLEGLAAVAGTQREPERAAKLFAASEALRQAAGLKAWRDYQGEVERDVAAARTQVDQETWQKAWAEGQTMTLEEAVADALSLMAEE